MRVKITIESIGTSIELFPQNSIESEILKKLPPQLEVKRLGGNGELSVLLYEDPSTKGQSALEDRSKLEQLKEQHDKALKSEAWPPTSQDYQDLRKAVEERVIKERSKTEQLINSAKESTHGPSPVDDSPFERALKR